MTLAIVDHGDDHDRADVAALVALFAELGVRPYEQLGVVEARRAMDGVVRSQAEAPRVSARDILVPGAAGRLPARVYNEGGSRPLVIYLHGGGWTVGGIRSTDRPMRRLAVEADATVVSIEYRLAPENPFPAPLDDCVVAVGHVLDHAAEFATGPVSLLGDSAGGNLAAAVAIDRGGADIDRLLLVYPCLGPVVDAGSYLENADAPVVSRATMEWFWQTYLSGASPDARAFPLQAVLAHLPPTTVVTAERDVLRDEGEAFARAVSAAGGAAELHRFTGAVHGFWGLDALLTEQADELTELLASRLR